MISIATRFTACGGGELEEELLKIARILLELRSVQEAAADRSTRSQPPQPPRSLMAGFLLSMLHATGLLLLGIAQTKQNHTSGAAKFNQPDYHKRLRTSVSKS